MSDQVFLQGLRVTAVMGVYEWEQQAPRELLLNLALDVDLRAAGHSDDLADALDYAAVADLAQQVADSARWNLLERYAEVLLARLLAQYPALSAVSLELHKPGAVPAADSVGIRMRRSASAEIGRK